MGSTRPFSLLRSLAPEHCVNNARDGGGEESRRGLFPAPQLLMVPMVKHVPDKEQNDTKAGFHFTSYYA